MDWIALIGPEVEENLGLRYLASALEAAGFGTEILPFNSGRDLPPLLRQIELAPEPPLLVALSLAFQWRALDTMALAMALRSGGYDGHITGGGHFGTFAHEELLNDFPELDSVCLHEAEQTIVELAAALKRADSLERIKGLARRAEQGQDAPPQLRPPVELDTLAWPDRRGNPTSCLGHPIATLVGSRGCYANCAFCCIAAWHRLGPPASRLRLRSVTDVADEMALLHRRHGTEIFIFHDDNFFLPDEAQSLDRVNALADALTERGIERFTTVVKARPNDVTQAVFSTMRERLHCSRVFLGVETAASQGLRTLGRGVAASQNREAMKVLDALGIYVCFNMLIFDPDTDPESLQTNFDFMEQHGHSPSNFGRVELYAGTPLLKRLQDQGRCRGDYLGWDYELSTPEMQRVFALTMRSFYPRNFADSALANRLMGTRYDVEVCRWFHPELFRDDWLVEAKALSQALTRDSVAGLREIVNFVSAQGVEADAGDLIRDLGRRLRRTEAELRARAKALEELVQSAVGARCHHTRSGWVDLKTTASGEVVDGAVAETPAPLEIA